MWESFLLTVPEIPDHDEKSNGKSKTIDENDQWP